MNVLNNNIHSSRSLWSRKSKLWIFRNFLQGDSQKHHLFSTFHESSLPQCQRLISIATLIIDSSRNHNEKYCIHDLISAVNLGVKGERIFRNSSQKSRSTVSKGSHFPFSWKNQTLSIFSKRNYAVTLETRNRPWIEGSRPTERSPSTVWVSPNN